MFLYWVQMQKGTILLQSKRDFFSDPNRGPGFECFTLIDTFSQEQTNCTITDIVCKLECHTSQDKSFILTTLISSYNRRLSIDGKGNPILIFFVQWARMVCMKCQEEMSGLRL